MNIELDKSAQDVAAEGAILNEMLELVAKRAALRPTDSSLTGHSSLQSSENVSLPVLPPQTTINPLLQHEIYNSNNGNRYRNSNVQHTFSSQSHNQEHEVSSNIFDGMEHFYLRSNLSLLHDCEILYDLYIHKIISQKNHLAHNSTYTFSFNRQTLLVIFEFLFLYVGIIVFSFSILEK